MLFRGRAEPEAVPGAGTRWPLDEGTVLRFSMSRASSEVNDNKVRSGILGMGPPRGRTSLRNVGFGVCRSLSASSQREGSPSTKPGCSSPASVSAEAPQPGIHPDPLGAGSRGRHGDGKARFAASGGFAPPALAVPRGEGGSVPAGISLDVDADQDGVVEKNSPNKVPQPPPPTANPRAWWILSSLSPWGVSGELGLGTGGPRSHPAGQL